MNQIQIAHSIKIKNIIDIGVSFSAMTRLFEQGSNRKITEKLEAATGLLDSIECTTDFELMHMDFCDWFINNICTAPRAKNNNQQKASQRASYGQAAKVLNVALKVFVYYCNLPENNIADHLLPMLHCTVDTPMMELLKMKYPQEGFNAVTIGSVHKPDYFLLQRMVMKHIQDDFDNTILPVHYDDIIWYQLNRRTQ